MPKGYPKSAHAISRIEFFCDDRRVGDALRALVNVAIGAPSVQPVVNAQKKRNGLAAVSSGNAVEQFAAFLAETKPAEITPASMRTWMESVGLSGASYSYLLKHAIAAKLLKKHPKASTTQGRYVVLPQKTAKSKS